MVKIKHKNKKMDTNYNNWNTTLIIWDGRSDNK